MDKAEHKRKDKPRLNVGFGIGIGEYTSSILAGIASGVVTAGKTIRDKFHDDVKHATDFKDFLVDQAQELSKIKPIIEDEKQGLTPKAFKEFSVKIQNKKKEQAELLEQRIKELRGVRKSIIGGTLDRAALMSKRSVKDIIFNTTIGAAVGAALTLGFFNGIATRDKIERIDNAVEPELNAIKSETERTTRHVDRLAEAQARHKKKVEEASVASAR